MPVYKGSTEVTSGNLHKGSTEIQNGYKAADSFYVNETTLTIIFVDNTATGSSLNSTSSAVFTGSPGSAFSTFSRSVNRTNGTYAVTGASVSEAGDSGNNVSTSVSGSGNVSRNISISGTIPITTRTITLTVNSTVNTLLARTATLTGAPLPSGGNTNGFNWNGAVSWSGGAPSTASLGVSSNYDGLGGFGSKCALATPNGTVSTEFLSSAPNHTSASGSISISNGATYGAGTTGGFGSVIQGTTYISLSVGESSTYQSFSVSKLVW